MPPLCVFIGLRHNVVLGRMVSGRFGCAALEKNPLLPDSSQPAPAGMEEARCPNVARSTQTCLAGAPVAEFPLGLLLCKYQLARYSAQRHHFYNCEGARLDAAGGSLLYKRQGCRLHLEVL